jgi:hypothetical protein
MHQHLFKNGDFQDVVIMAVCANDVEEEKGPDDKIG